MKKRLFLLCLAMLLSGCGQTEAPETTSIPSETEQTSAVTEAQIPMSQEMAMLEGYVVMQDGDVRHNAGSWFAFLEKADAGEIAQVTIIQFVHDGNASTQVRFDVSYDGKEYLVAYEQKGQSVTQRSQTLMREKGTYDDAMEPYDCYEAYTLKDIVLYQDRIAEPDFEGVKEIFLHAKEGDPPVKAYQTVEAVDPILQLLMGAQWMAYDSEDAVYGMKLLMTNRDGKELVLELDLLRGVFRHGTQSYAYGSVSDLFAALEIQNWPDSVIEEFRPFLH